MDRIRAAVHMGRALEVQGKFDKAIEKYDEALGIDADNKEAEAERERRAKIVAADIARWTEVARAANIKLEQ